MILTPDKPQTYADSSGEDKKQLKEDMARKKMTCTGCSLENGSHPEYPAET